MSARPPVPSTRLAFLAHLDPIVVLRLVNNDLDAGNELAPYETLYQTLRDAYLKRHGDTTLKIATLLKSTTASSSAPSGTPGSSSASKSAAISCSASSISTR
jgi:hypothetical protein